MLIKVADLEAIANGRIDTQFRCWRRPTVKTGGTLMTAVGVLAIDMVEPVGDEISDEEARRAGFSSREHLVAALAGRGQGQIYRIRLRHLGPDPRIALRGSLDDLAEVQVSLARMDGGLHGRKRFWRALPKIQAFPPSGLPMASAWKRVSSRRAYAA